MGDVDFGKVDDVAFPDMVENETFVMAVRINTSSAWIGSVDIRTGGRALTKSPRTFSSLNISNKKEY